jgi:hypothetical protein
LALAFPVVFFFFYNSYSIYWKWISICTCGCDPGWRLVQ